MKSLIILIFILTSLYATEVIHGHVLPPEPDPVLNNATLLGIDSNHNGVRDDVERAIYLHYKTAVEQAVIMQRMKVFQTIFADVNRTINAKKLQRNFTISNDCISFLLSSKNIEVADHSYVKNIQLNTKNRLKAYLDYDNSLSGGVYGSGPKDWTESACDFNVTKILELQP